METTKFINKDWALLAATTTFMAVVKTGHYANLSGSEDTGQFILDVHLEIDELFTLPFGYVYSGVKEDKYQNPMTGCPPFKNKKYYFTYEY